MRHNTHTSLWAERAEALGRRRSVVVWTALAVATAATAYAYGLPSLYRSSATLVVEGQMPEALVAQTVGGETNQRLQMIKQQALSRARLTELVERFDLYGYSSGKLSTDDALGRMQRDIRVEPTSSDQTANGRPTTVAFKVSYVGTDPKVTADVTNAVASFYASQNDRMRSQQASQTTELLGQELAEMRKQLDAQEARVRTYTARNSGALPQQLDANIAAIGRFDMQLRTNEQEKLRLLERRQRLQGDLADLSARPPAPVVTSEEEGRVAKAQTELADLQTRLKDTHPDVKAAKSRLAQAQADAAAVKPIAGPTGPPPPSPRSALEASLGEVESQMKRIESENTRLKSQISGYQSRVENVPHRAPELDGIVRDYAAARDRYDALQKRYDEARLSERAEGAGSTQQFKIIDPAVPAGSPSGPARMVLAVMGLLLAVVVGACVGLAKDRLDPTFQSLDELRTFTKVPILGVIPEIASVQGQRAQRARAASLGLAGVIALVAVAAGAFLMAGRSDDVVRLLSRVG